MKVADVCEAVAKLSLEAKRERGIIDEEIHEERDELYIALLKSIAEGECDDPATAAKEVLRLEKIPFRRWYS